MKPKLVSSIDLNELVHFFPEPLQDSIWLEVAMLLKRAAGGPSPPRSQVNGSKGGIPSRHWIDHADGMGNLAALGRVYRINRDAARPPHKGMLGEVWKHVLAHKGETITYEGIGTICRGVKGAKPAAMVSALWSKNFIDVKKVAQAS